MSEPVYFKTSCGACDGHIAYPETSAGMKVACPHCGKEVYLAYQTAAPEIVEATIVDANHPQVFRNQSTPPAIRPPYQNPQVNGSGWGNHAASVLLVLGFICYAFGLVDFCGMFFHYDITGVPWSPIVAGLVGSGFVSAGRKNKVAAVQDSNNSRKSVEGVIWVGAIISVLMAIGAIIYFASGRHISTANLEAEVRQSIQDKFSKDPDKSGTQITSFGLVHESGGKYKGVLVVQHGTKSETEDVDVTFDGRNFIWKTVPLSVSPDSTPAPQPVAVQQPEPQSQETTPSQQPEAPATLRYDWNTTENDATKNGNIGVAVNWVNRYPSIRRAAIAPAPQYIAKSPWNYYGKVVKVAGVVGFIQDYPAGSDSAIDGKASSDIVIMCDDGTIAESLCMSPSGNITKGCTVNLYGYPVGVTEVPNRVGGTDTHLMMVGNDYDNYGVRN